MVSSLVWWFSRSSPVRINNDWVFHREKHESKVDIACRNRSYTNVA